MSKKVKLGDIIKPRKEKVLPADFSDMPFIGMEEHVEEHTMRFLGTVPASSMKSAANRFYADDVLYGRLRPYLNKVYKPQCDGLCSAEFIVFPKTEGIHPDFLRYRLNSQDLISFASHLDTGDRPRVNFDGLSSFELYLPASFEKQQQIVTEIDTQFSRLDEAVASLKRIQANLKRYKAAVLKAAVEGNLTEQWRKDHPDVEPADQLLKRILAERRAKWEESVGAKQGVSASPGFSDVGNNVGDCNKGEAGESLASPLPQMKVKGIKPKDDSWKKKYKEPAGPAMANLPELPEGWVWATYAQTGTLNLGRQRAPKYHSGPNMRQYLRVQNVFEDRIDLSDVMEMDFPPSDFEKYELRSGDMLLNEGQSPELLGRPAIYRGELPGACFTNTLIRFRAVTGVSVEFALLVSRYYMRARRFLEEGTITTNIAHLSLGRLATIEFPLPCLAEQQTIVAEAERLISVTEELETTIETNLKRAERLRQTILQRAFSGGLP